MLIDVTIHQSVETAGSCFGLDDLPPQIANTVEQLEI